MAESGWIPTQWSRSTGPGRHADIQRWRTADGFSWWIHADHNSAVLGYGNADTLETAQSECDRAVVALDAADDALGGLAVAIVEAEVARG